MSSASRTAACPSCAQQVPLTPRTQAIAAHDEPGRRTRCAGGGHRPTPGAPPGAPSGATPRRTTAAAPAIRKPDRTAACRHCTHEIAVGADGRMLQHWAKGGTCPGSRRKVAMPEPVERAAPAHQPRAATSRSGLGARTAVAVLAALAVAVVVVARDDAPTTAGSTATADRPPVERPEPLPGPDTSLRDALTEAGLSDGLVTRMGQVAYSTGYTVDSSEGQVETIAYMQLLTCREVQSGYRTWAEILEADVADGAPTSSARTMLQFLQSDYCPAVRGGDSTRAAEPAAETAAVRADGSDANGMRGLLSEPGYLDAAYPAVAVGRCAAVVGPDEDLRAYELPSKALLCVTPASHPGWRNHVISADVVFESPVDVERALVVARTVLPADVTEGRRQAHTNPPHAPGDGGCLGVELRTVELGRYFRTFDKPAVAGAVAVLYSGKQTSGGASAPFAPSSVQQVSLTTGEIEPAFDGGYYC